MSNVVNVVLWAKAEVFNYGAIPVAPHPRLNFTNIKKIVIYAKSKGVTCFPKLSYTVWKHIACNKLRLSEELAWLYFDACLFFCGEELVHRNDGDVGMQSCVHTLTFVLFLYIQHISRVSLNHSLLSGWPLPALSCQEVDVRLSPRRFKMSPLDDRRHLTFILNNLSEMLALISEHDIDNSMGLGAMEVISVDAVEALGFFICGYVEKFGERPVSMRLGDIARHPAVAHTISYSKVTKSFSRHNLQVWLRDCLKQNPYGISACLSLSARLLWTSVGQNDCHEGKFYSGMPGKIVTNATTVPRQHVGCDKLVVISQVCKQTVARNCCTLENSIVIVHRCHRSYLYLLSPLRAVTIDNCRDTTLVLGPVRGSVHVSNCGNLTVITACRTVMVSGSTRCTLHLLTPNGPLLLSGNSSIALAPYNAHYPLLGHHLEQVGLSPTPNLWDRPVCVGPDHKEDVSVWERLHHEGFHMFSVPFDVHGPEKVPKISLPATYSRALTDRRKRVDRWQEMVKGAGLTDTERRQFQTAVEGHFHAWLSQTGHKRELDSLAASVNVVKTHQ